MVSKKYMFILASVFTLSVSTSASAAFTHGALASTGTQVGNCNSSWCTINDSRVYAEDGGVNASTASSTLGTSAQAYTTLNGSLNSPVLKSYTSSSTGDYAGSSAQGIQLYQYTGSDPFTLTVTTNYHGFLSGDGAYLSGEASLVKAAGNQDAMEDLFAAGYMSNLYESSISFFDLNIDSKRTNGEESPGENFLTFDLSLNLNSGDMFYLWTAMHANSYSAATVNALNTGTFSFNTTNLVALGGVSAVPVPAAAWLFLPSLMGFIALRRSKQQSA
jgi:hypothetical protein